MTNLTDVERQVIRQLRKVRVATTADLAKVLDVSTKTVRRALAKTSYYSSINANSAYVTLQETPRFNEDGLWFHHKKICFSRYRTLQATLQSLVEKSNQGCSVTELEQLVGTRVANHVSQLQQQDRIQHFYCGRHVIYASREQRQFEQQRRIRLEPTSRQTQTPQTDVPDGTDPVTVIRLLVRILEKPTASIASLSKSLQAQGVAIDAGQIRQVIDFYGLKKTKP